MTDCIAWQSSEEEIDGSTTSASRSDIQLTKADYADEEIDRGHMVRREDPNWDDSLPSGNPAGLVTGLAKTANDDTFRYTNAVVQYGDLNSSSQLWRGLEDYVLTSASTRGFKACVFTVPVTRDDDLEIGPDVIAPREFWKVVVIEDADAHTLHATAYLQGELIRDLLEKRRKVQAVEGFVLGGYRTYQIAIADLADATGYDVSWYEPFDPLNDASGHEGLEDRDPVFLPVDAENQIAM